MGSAGGSKQITSFLPTPTATPSHLQWGFPGLCRLPQSRLFVSFLPSPPEGNQRQASAFKLHIPWAFSTIPDRKEVLSLISPRSSSRCPGSWEMCIPNLSVPGSEEMLMWDRGP